MNLKAYEWAIIIFIGLMFLVGMTTFGGWIGEFINHHFTIQIIVK